MSVLKSKTLFNQRGSFVHREFHGTESMIVYPSFFILVLKKLGGTVKKTLCIIVVRKIMMWDPVGDGYFEGGVLEMVMPMLTCWKVPLCRNRIRSPRRSCL